MKQGWVQAMWAGGGGSSQKTYKKLNQVIE